MARHKVYVIKVAGKPCLQLRWKDASGKWRQQSTDETRRREAERLADKKAKQLDSGVTRHSLDWYDFCDRYRVERLSMLRPSSRSDWETASKLYGELMSPSTIRDVTANELSKFGAALRQPYVYIRKGETRTKYFSQDRIAKFLGELRRAMTWAAKIRLIEDVPFIAIPSSRSSGSMHARPVTAEEFDRMLAVVPAVVNDMVAGFLKKTRKRQQTDVPALTARLIASWTDTLHKYWLSGFRLEEATMISWDQPELHCIEGIDRMRPKLRIRGEFEKGKRDRLYPLTPDFVEYLRRTPKQERTGLVIRPLTTRGFTKSKTTIGRQISTIGRRAGIVVDIDPLTKQKKFASAHDMRRSFGTRWAPLVKPITLQHLMRHTSITTTMKFYVDQDATGTADEVWEAFGTRHCDPLCDPLAVEAIEAGQGSSRKS